MATVFNEGIYPYVTLKLDSQGDLHMWEGQVTVSDNSLMPLADGKFADTFIHQPSDIWMVQECLTEEEWGMLTNGYSIQTRNVPDDLLFQE